MVCVGDVQGRALPWGPDEAARTGRVGGGDHQPAFGSFACDQRGVLMASLISWHSMAVLSSIVHVN